MPTKEEYQRNRDYYLNYRRQYYKNNPEKFKKYNQKRYQKDAEKIKLMVRNYKRKKRADCKVKGICTTCFNKPAMPYHVRCIECWDKKRVHDRQRNGLAYIRSLSKQKEREYRLRAEGRCIGCRVKISTGHVRCINCRMVSQGKSESKWGKYATINRKLTEQSQHLRIRG